jgi:hypothetical protein
MPTPVSFVQLTIALPKRDYAVYHDCIGMLTQVMGKKAPDLLALIVHTLRCRDSQGLAEDYLESVHWPLKVTNESTRGLQQKNTRMLRRVGLSAAPYDPSRN